MVRSATRSLRSAPAEASLLDYFDRRRQLREMEDEALKEGRIPPGQSLTVKWPVLHSGTIPPVDLRTWRFRIFGLVGEEREFTWQEFSSLPRVTRNSDIHCVTRWTKLNNQWEGVPVTDVLSHVSVKPDAQFVMVHAPGYTANLPLSALLDDDALFAFKHDGQEIALDHGGPVRLVVPKRYFWKSVKWVNGLEFMAEDRPGFWEALGYHVEGDPWSEERFSP